MIPPAPTPSAGWCPDEFTREDFDDPAIWSDMTSPRYLELQKTLNQLRTLNSTRYLYTAKLGEDGQTCLPAWTDLDLGAEDFAYPGTRIEEEMAPCPYIQTALSGEPVYSRDVVDTTWGPIFTACYPVKDENGQVMGAAVRGDRHEHHLSIFEEK